MVEYRTLYLGHLVSTPVYYNPSHLIYMPIPPSTHAGKTDVQYRLDSAMQDVNDMYILLEEAEKNAVRNSLVEERSRFCMLATFLKPVVVRKSLAYKSNNV